MDNETLFYVCGIILAASALVVSFAGLKLKDFPGRALPLVVLWFAIFVVGATTFAVRYSGEEQEARAAELEEAGAAIEEAEGEGGGITGQTEENEEKAEAGAEGSGEEEPVGPSEGSEESKGQGSKGGGAESATTLDLAASPTALAFDKTELSAKPGKVTIDFTNPSAIPHNVVIEKDGEELAGFEPIAEAEESVSADLEAGAYTFICSVPGHAQAGMEGTLTVG